MRWNRVIAAACGAMLMYLISCGLAGTRGLNDPLPYVFEPWHPWIALAWTVVFIGFVSLAIDVFTRPDAGGER